MRTKEDITEAVNLHADTVLRACSVYLRNRADQEDAFQEAFLRYARSDTTFDGEEHRKAWLIRVATNICKDRLRSAAMRTESLDALEESGMPVPDGEDADPACGMEAEDAARDVRDALLRLDEKYRMPLYLRYYEGYTAARIGEVLGLPENTVYTRMARGKRLMREVLGNGE